jgi:hypothetical protein
VSCRCWPSGHYTLPMPRKNRALFGTAFCKTSTSASMERPTILLRDYSFSMTCSIYARACMLLYIVPLPGHHNYSYVLFMSQTDCKFCVIELFCFSVDDTIMS